MMGKTEQGTALVFTMIFLGLMIAAGLVSVQFSSMQQKMAASYRNNQSAFFAAEGTLKEAEQCIKTQTVCSSITGFAADCSNGLCFTGSDSGSIPSCRAGNNEPWEDSIIWNDATKTRAATMLAGNGVSARYLIEFICYVPKAMFGVTPNPSNPADWSQLYRVTVIASVDNLNNRVMLQSTYRR